MKKIHLFIAFCFLFAINVLGQESIPDYFCISIDASTSTYTKFLYLKVNGKLDANPKVEYKINDGNWTMWEDKSFAVELNDKVYFRAGENGSPTTNKYFSKDFDNYINITVTNISEISASGNIMSLIDGENFENLTTVPENAFIKFFQASTTASQNKLTNIEHLRMPATKVSSRCYASMFANNEQLVNVPSDLLPATTLADSCYFQMFYKCTKITDAPTLPAKTLNKYCYFSMFDGCSKLGSVEVGFSKWPTISWMSEQPSDYYATKNWLQYVCSTGILTAPEGLPDEVDGSSKKPSGWELKKLAKLTLSPESATLCIGETFTLTPILDAQLEGKTITWSSDDDNIVTVSNEGIVTARDLGTATITAAIEEMSLSATCEITVQNIPASVTDLSVTPDEDGAIKANISFTIPSTNKLGENLTGTLTATILRNDAVIYTTDAKNLGDNVTYSDEFDAEDNPEAGFYTYSVFVTYNDVNSDNTSVSQFIGFDKLAPAQNFAATDNISGNTETIHFSWDAVEGQNQGYINLDKVTYNIYAVDSKNAQIEPAINDEPITGTSFDYTCTDIEQEDQKFVVQAILNEDSSTSESISAILGKAYDLPFIEEFESKDPYFNNYWTDLNTSTSSLSKYSENVGSGNFALKVGGFFSANTEFSSRTSEYLSGKINFTNKDLPKLCYDVKSSNSNANNNPKGLLKVEAIDNNGNSYLLKDSTTTTTEYKKHELSLENINAEWIRLKFTATVYGGEESGSSYLHLNDITLCNIIRPESVILSPASGTLSMDGTDNRTLNLTATIAPADVDDATVTWSSSDTDVVEVDENGVVTAVGCGKAVITATANLMGANNTDIIGVCNISVTGNTSIKDMDDNDIFVQLSEGETFNINDGEIKNISIAKTIKGVDVTYNRLFKNYAWLPWYMPFDVTLTEELLQDFDFAQFAGAFYYTDNIKEGEMCITVQKMKLDDVVYANTPYMIRAKNPDSENAQTLEISSVTIVPTQEQVFEQLMRSATLDFNIKGIYNQYVSKADANSTLYYFTSKFTFSRITAADKSVNPFRFYMNIVPRTDNPYTQKVEETPAEIKIRTLDEDDADGIININFTDNDNVNWYDLSGRKVTNKSLPLAKGVYIYNGKKVLCK